MLRSVSFGTGLTVDEHCQGSSNDLDFDEIQVLLTGHVQNQSMLDSSSNSSSSSLNSSLARELGEGALISNHIASAGSDLYST